MRELIFPPIVFASAQILNMKPHPSPPPCYGGLLITAWPLTIVISIMVQCFITAWRVDHRKRIYMRHHPHQHAGHAGHNAGHMTHSGPPAPPGNPHVPMRRSQSRTRETREEARQRKFRYLYQVRTARGDIISQVRSKCATAPPQSHDESNLISLCLSLVELRFGAAKAHPAERDRDTVGTFDQDQLKRAEHIPQRSHPLHDHTRSGDVRQDRDRARHWITNKQ